MCPFDQQAEGTPTNEEAEEIRRLLEDFRAGKISRREFMRRSIIVTRQQGGGQRHDAALMPAKRLAQPRSPPTIQINTHDVKYDGKTGLVVAYLARPAKAAKYPAHALRHRRKE